MVLSLLVQIRPRYCIKYSSTSEAITSESRRGDKTNTTFCTVATNIRESRSHF